MDGGSGARIARAPGRVNLIGEHTDYNEGFVLPIAIDRAITLTFEPTDDGRVEVGLESTGERDGFALEDIGPRTGRWIDYVAGTAWAMADAGLPTRGFRGSLASDLPQGAGLSSSAALELASAFALSGGEAPSVDRMTMAQIAQRGENEYVGVACGLMDQFASLFGQPDAALFLDCRNFRPEVVPLALDDVALVVADSGVARRLDGSAYNDRRAECAAAAAAIAASEPRVRTLRDVTPQMLDEVSGGLDPVLARRARHVVTENVRTLAAAVALQSGDLVRFGRLLDESHASLRDLFEVSSPVLDALVEIARSVPGVLGSRLTGAGFGGCTITLVRREALDSLMAAIREQYPARTGLTPSVFEVRPAAGAGMVHAG